MNNGQNVDVLASLLWQRSSEDENGLFKRNLERTLVFGIFPLDKLANTDAELKKVRKLWQEIVKPWNECYPWGQFLGVRTEELENDLGTKYIFGHLVVGDILDQEFLVVALLQRLSILCGLGTFIKVCDSDGDFLLMESSEVLPECYEFPVGNNRLYIHEGSFKFIPPTVAQGVSLYPHEALQFLRDSYFKCLEVPQVSKRLMETIVKPFPLKFLKSLRCVEIKFKRGTHSEVLLKNLNIVSILLEHAFSEEVFLSDEVGASESDGHESVLEGAKIVIPFYYCEILASYATAKGAKSERDRELLYGRLLSHSLQDQLKSGLLTESQLNHGPNGVENIIERLQNLKEFPNNSDFELKSAPDFAQETSTQDIEHDLEEEAVGHLQTLFEQLKSSLDGNCDEYGQDDDDASENDERLGKYFQKEDIDIDEEDFFEFFLTEALQEKGGLDKYRS
ncbi:LAMI_0F04566g1_1 [Lachancea mirantina]|uniref:LAMI_0F04566g1_1 n=1 Tax=Lachancea mirantina TaxID=1230905 RepID=A0A1G4JY39_9SACH|nr:LAMI_0F04566g1_1 [Lachancea mirantina]